ncbi:putative carboxylesterase 17 [Nymphaea thermarum]|nr:putative carboxylesterase 17 [Nymphaea thermarum]
MVAAKKVVEEVSGWLRVFADGTVDRTWTGPKEVSYMLEPVTPSNKPDDGISIRDVVIDPDSGALARIYLPEEAPESGKLPILLHFHGGGFCVGEPNMNFYYAFYSSLVKKAGVVCVSPWLRLAPENRHPAALNDAYAGLMWLRSVARAEASEPWLESRADFGRVFLIGDSSGGNLVHAVAARAGEGDISPLVLRGAIPVHPGFVRSTRSKSELSLQSESAFLTLDMVDKFLALSLPIGSTKDHPLTCPMGEAAPPLDTLNLPDFLVPVADNDLIRDTELEYIEAMKKAGQKVEVLMNFGVGHCFYLNRIAVDTDPHVAQETEKFIEGITRFIKERD